MTNKLLQVDLRLSITKQSSKILVLTAHLCAWLGACNKKKKKGWGCGELGWAAVVNSHYFRSCRFFNVARTNLPGRHPHQTGRGGQQ